MKRLLLNNWGQASGGLDMKITPRQQRSYFHLSLYDHKNQPEPNQKDAEDIINMIKKLFSDYSLEAKYDLCKRSGKTYIENVINTYLGIQFSLSKPLIW